MRRLLNLAPVLALAACVHGNPVNNENFFGMADVTKVDWTKVDGRGSSCQTNWFFGLLPTGSNSLASAVERGDIARIAYVDTDTELYLPLLMYRDCTNVYGELKPAARAAMARHSAEDNRNRAGRGATPPMLPAAVDAQMSDYVLPIGG